MSNIKDQRNVINQHIQKYFSERGSKEFVPGVTKIHYAEPIFGAQEVTGVLSSLLDGWLVIGNHAKMFERMFTESMGSSYCVTVNSGSSANLLAWACLRNPRIDNRLHTGDEIITSALSHPATINAILFNRLKPVLVDVDPETYNIDPLLVEKAISKKTRGIFPTHFLGNPCDMTKLQDIVRDNALHMVEDCCDAHGAEYGNSKVGTFGEMGTFSFYAAHMITMGEGGAIIGNNLRYEAVLKSLRGWGAMCSTCKYTPCKVAVDPNYKCPMRFKMGIKGLEHYDSRHLFIDIGYNLKIVEMQAAFGIGQIKRMPSFIKARRENWKSITKFLKDYDEYLVIQKPTPKSKPAWFAVGITVRPDAPFGRFELVKWLEENKIETRYFFGGNVINQPAYSTTRFKIAGKLKNAELATRNSFFIGCQPNITKEMISYMAEVFDHFFENLSRELG